MESQNDRQPKIPKGFTSHSGGSTPAYVYDTRVSVFFRDGREETDILDNFDFAADHTGSSIDILGYKVMEEPKEQQLGTLGPAIGIPSTILGQQVLAQRITGEAIAATTPPHVEPVGHPIDGADPTPKATRDNPKPADPTYNFMNVPTGDNLGIPDKTKYGTQYVPNLPKQNSTTDDYKSLSDVLERAYQQAAHGKGKDRHAQGQPFDKQPMQTISQLVGSCDGLRYQAIKKIQEAARLDHDAAIRELLGAINYIAGAIIYMEAQHAKEPKIHGFMVKRNDGEWKLYGNSESEK
jgi:hypothetical protein